MPDKTKTTIEAYNQNFSCYADKFMQFSPYVTQVLMFAELLNDGAKVLDIGCGPGNVAKQLCAAKKIAVTGIDLSPEMIKLAKSNVPSGTFTIQDSRIASFQEQEFDAAVLSFSIVHLYDDEAYKLLANAAKWVKSGGYFYVSFMEGKQPGFETTSFSKMPLYFNYFTEARIKEWLLEYGVQCITSKRQLYLESDGSETTDVFIFGKKAEG